MTCKQSIIYSLVMAALSIFAAFIPLWEHGYIAKVASGVFASLFLFFSLLFVVIAVRAHSGFESEEGGR